MSPLGRVDERETSNRRRIFCLSRAFCGGRSRRIPALPFKSAARSALSIPEGLACSCSSANHLRVCVCAGGGADIENVQIERYVTDAL